MIVYQAKKLVSEATTLVHFDTNKPIKVYCDASSVGVGACLMDFLNGQERPVAYASWTLSPAEAKYAQIEREALAIVFAVRKFHQYLYGREFVLVTDHRSLCKIFGHDQGVPPLAAARMQRWALILSAYQYRIQYISGEQNNCADCMSRLPLVKSSLDEDTAVLALSLNALPVTSSDIVKATKKDETLATVLQLVWQGHWPLQASEPLKPYVRRQHELSCPCGVTELSSQIVCALVY